jgi:hypothetical protein
MVARTLPDIDTIELQEVFDQVLKILDGHSGRFQDAVLVNVMAKFAEACMLAQGLDGDAVLRDMRRRASMILGGQLAAANLSRKPPKSLDG